MPKTCKTCKQSIKPITPKMKWVDIDSEIGEATTYRLTFEIYPEDLDQIQNEITNVGSLIKTEKEVVDNG